MILDNPVTVHDHTGNSVVIQQLDIVLMDHNARKIVFARLAPCPKPLILWRNAEYDEAGDYTQEDAENRIKELLGSDIQASLQELYRVSTV
jgi:hypothetical protein